MDDLPIGWTDEQATGRYRLRRREDQALFGYTVGPHSWKRFFHPPAVKLWRASRSEGGFRTESDPLPNGKLALVGVRACELSAIAIQDKVLMGGAFVDPVYEARRRGAFIVAVQCGQAGQTCFCVSMAAGRRGTRGFDLAMTEILESADHYFVVNRARQRATTSWRTSRACRQRPSTRRPRGLATTAREAEMGRTMDTTDIKALLYAA